MDAPSDAIDSASVPDAPLDVEAVFHIHYERIARVIARVIRDPGRAEEIAVEVFLKWSRHPRAHGDQTGGWLYRTAIRMALDELRRRTRRSKYERLVNFIRMSPSPEDLRASKESQDNVRVVLAAIPRRQAELLLLRSDGLSYNELAGTLKLNPTSVGTLLARAQQAFRKECMKRYGSI